MMPGMEDGHSVLVAIYLQEDILDVRATTETPPNLPLLLSNSETCHALTCVVDDCTWNDMHMVDIATTYFTDNCMNSHPVVPVPSLGLAFLLDIAPQDDSHVMPLRLPASHGLLQRSNFDSTRKVHMRIFVSCNARDAVA